MGTAFLQDTAGEADRCQAVVPDAGHAAVRGRDRRRGLSLLWEAGFRPKLREEGSKPSRDGSKFRQHEMLHSQHQKPERGHLDGDGAPRCRIGLSNPGRTAWLSTLVLNLASPEENKTTRQGLDGEFQEHTHPSGTRAFPPTRRVETVLTKGRHW